jgi:hypothetical protein
MPVVRNCTQLWGDCGVVVKHCKLIPPPLPTLLLLLLLLLLLQVLNVVGNGVSDLPATVGTFKGLT